MGKEELTNDKTIGTIIFQIAVIFLMIMILFAIGENTRVQRQLNNSLNPQTQQELIEKELH